MVVLAMRESMAARTPLDLAQPSEVAALEIAIAVLEFPQGLCVRTPSVEDVAFCGRDLAAEGRGQAALTRREDVPL